MGDPQLKHLQNRTGGAQTAPIAKRRRMQECSQLAHKHCKRDWILTDETHDKRQSAVCGNLVKLNKWKVPWSHNIQDVSLCTMFSQRDFCLDMQVQDLPTYPRSPKTDLLGAEGVGKLVLIHHDLPVAGTNDLANDLLGESAVSIVELMYSICAAHLAACI
jgi:hypothetical protein